MLRGEGQVHQVLRDLGLMASDVAHVALPWRELARHAGARRGVPPSHLVRDKEALAAAAGVAALWILSACIPG